MGHPKGTSCNERVVSQLGWFTKPSISEYDTNLRPAADSMRYHSKMAGKGPVRRARRLERLNAPPLVGGSNLVLKRCHAASLLQDAADAAVKIGVVC